MKLARAVFLFPALLATLQLLSRASASGQVFVVDDTPGPGVDFTDLQAAIDAAGEGDTILLKSGNYSPSAGSVFVIAGKSLTLTEDLVALATLKAGLKVRDLHPAQQVTLRGFHIDTLGTGAAPALEIENCAGAVWIEDAFLRTNSNGAGGSPPADAIRATNGAALTLISCLAFAAPSGALSTQPGTGLRATATNACLYDCLIRGGQGASSPGLATGGAGALVDDGFLFASDTRFIGGLGAAGQALLPSETCSAVNTGGAGGDALRLQGAAPQAATQDCIFTPGAGGAGGSCLGAPACPSGPAGAEILALSGTHTALAGQGRSVEAPSPIREDQGMQISYFGQPGDLAVGAISAIQDFAYLPNLSGVLLLNAPLQIVFAGSLGSANIVHQVVIVDELGPGTESLVIYVQPGFLTSAGQAMLASPTAIVLLDSAL